jgi:DNA repair protein RecO (recombination protein O)
VREHLTTEAVVVRRVPYGEADVIATLVTRDAGKLTALARGARRSRRRFGAALELGVVAEVELRGAGRGGELWTLVQAQTRRCFAIGDVGALAHASYGAELVRELTPAEQPEPEAFALLVELYAAIAAHGPRPLVLRRFELRLLDAIGLQPALAACAGCGAPPEGDALLDPSRGALCRGCAVHARGLGLVPISAAAWDALRAAAGVAALAAAPLDDERELAREARAATAALIAHHVGRPLRSLEFLGKINATHPPA